MKSRTAIFVKFPWDAIGSSCSTVIELAGGPLDFDYGDWHGKWSWVANPGGGLLKVCLIEEFFIEVIDEGELVLRVGDMLSIGS